MLPLPLITLVASSSLAMSLVVIPQGSDVDIQLEVLTTTVFCMLDTVAPQKTVKVALDDPPWMDARIKTVIRQRNREFDKNAKSEKWQKLLQKSKLMIKTAKQKFALNFISNLKDTDPATWMKRMNKLGRASFENEHTSWRFQSEHLSDQEITDEIADFFANISNDFTPVDPSLLHLPSPGDAFVSEVPCLPTEEVKKKSIKSLQLQRKQPLSQKTSLLPFSSNSFPSLLNQP